MEYGTTEYSEWVLAHPGQAVLTVVSKKSNNVKRSLTKAVEIKFVKPRQASYKTHKEQPLVRLSFF